MIQEIILAALFLCSQTPDELLGIMKPAWNEKIGSDISEKAGIIRESEPISSFDLQQLFPAMNELSEGIDKESFNLSHLQQPSPFIRIRPGHMEQVLKKLDKQAVRTEFIPPSAIRLPNGFKVDDIFEVDKEVVVQDLSSQKIGELMNLDNQPQRITSIWDCCAASGGKSILAKDVLGDIDLSVSDVRESILVNLKKRFASAGIHQYNSFVADLSTHSPPAGQAGSPFDFIIADLPCTGSGTWSRTPEQLYFFEPPVIEKYSQIQKMIAANIIPHLKASGKLLYITCSVFKKENEDIIRFMQERFSLNVERSQILKGYDKKADTMFAAVLSRL